MQAWGACMQCVMISPLALTPGMAVREPKPSKEVTELAERAARLYVEGASSWVVRAALSQSNALPEHEGWILNQAGLDVSDTVARGDADPAAEAVVDCMNMLSSSVTVRQAADLLGISPSGVRRRIRRRFLAGIYEHGCYLVPHFQFDSDGLVPSFEDVYSVTPFDMPLIVFFRWFVQPSPDLPAGGQAKHRNLSPREWLLAEFDAGPVQGMAAVL